MNTELGEKPILIFYTSASDDKWIKCSEEINIKSLIQPELEDLLEVLKEKQKLVESIMKKIEQNV